MCLESFVNDCSYIASEVYLFKKASLVRMCLHVIEWPWRVKQMNFKEFCAVNLQISEIYLSKDLSKSSQLV